MVGQDAHLAHREEGGGEERGLVARRRPAVGGEVVVGAARGLAAVVPVGDVEARDGLEGGGDGLGVGDAPERMAHRLARSVVGDEVVERLGCRRGEQVLREGRVVGVGEHDRLGVGALREQVARAVVLLVGPRPLVAHDAPGVVLVDRDEAIQAGLRGATPRQAVGEEAGRVVLDERSRARHAVERVGARLVDGLGVLVDVVGKSDFGADDVQERALASAGEGARLGAGDDVVGDAGDLLGERGVGAEGAERADDGHRACGGSVRGVLSGGRARRSGGVETHRRHRPANRRLCLICSRRETPFGLRHVVGSL